jgi:hypothetical protein
MQKYKKTAEMIVFTRKEEKVPLLSTMVKYQITMPCHSLRIMNMQIIPTQYP